LDFFNVATQHLFSGNQENYKSSQAGQLVPGWHIWTGHSWVAICNIIWNANSTPW